MSNPRSKGFVFDRVGCAEVRFLPGDQATITTGAGHVLLGLGVQVTMRRNVIRLYSAFDLKADGIYVATLSPGTLYASMLGGKRSVVDRFYRKYGDVCGSPRNRLALRLTKDGTTHEAVADDVTVTSVDSVTPRGEMLIAQQTRADGRMSADTITNESVPATEMSKILLKTAC